MNIRTIAIAALLVGGGLIFGGTFDDAAPVTLVEPAAACADPRKGCGSCWVDEGDLENGVLPHLECHN